MGTEGSPPEARSDCSLSSADFEDVWYFTATPSHVYESARRYVDLHLWDTSAIFTFVLCYSTIDLYVYTSLSKSAFFFLLGTNFY
jgi:hypothetical protein